MGVHRLHTARVVLCLVSREKGLFPGRATIPLDRTSTVREQAPSLMGRGGRLCSTRPSVGTRTSMIFGYFFFCKGVSHQRPMDTCTSGTSSGFRPTASASPSEFHLIKRHVATLDYSRRVFFIRRRQYRIIKRLPSPVPTRATIVWNARLWRALASRAS